MDDGVNFWGRGQGDVVVEGELKRRVRWGSALRRLSLIVLLKPFITETTVMREATAIATPKMHILDIVFIKELAFLQKR